MIYKIKENRVSRTYIGGRLIDEFYGKNECKDSLYPEDWTASITTAYNSKAGCEEGIGYTVEGISVKDIVDKNNFKILVKLLNSSERLVLQAHPTVEYAKEFLHSDYGKTECWYFLDCEEEACVYIGFKRGVSRKEWEKAFYENDSEKMLSMLHRLPVKKGDFVFVDGGVPHAIGAGCFMVELQEPSDLMVVNEKFTPSGNMIPEQRIHMGLGYEKMFDVYDYTGYSLEEIKKKYCPQKTKMSYGLYRILGENLTDKFSMYMLKNKAKLDTDVKYRIGIVESGIGTICGVEVRKGDRLLICDENDIVAAGDNSFSVIICE